MFSCNRFFTHGYLFFFKGDVCSIKLYASTRLVVIFISRFSKLDFFFCGPGLWPPWAG